MKRGNYILIALYLIFFGCVNSDDFHIPDLEYEEPQIDGELTEISAVKSAFDPATEEIYTFEGTNMYFEAYVVSSDEGGNFYKKLVLQDHPSNPNAGIQILIDDNSLFQTYNFGRKVYVKLDGLSLWFNNGVLQLGKQLMGDVVPIPRSIIEDFIVRSAKTYEITPLQLSISEFDIRYNNLYVRLDKVQFNRNLVTESNRFTFAGNSAIDQYDGERQLESCETGTGVLLSTSTYSDFKSLLLPTGSGSITGVLTRDFFDEHFIMVLNTPDTIDFSDSRCDPIYLDCGADVPSGVKTIFSENFTGITNADKLQAEGWINVNINGGNKRFDTSTFNGDRFLRISGYNVNESPFEVWAISPEISLDTTTDEILYFDLLSSYDNGILLSVLGTTNYTGNPLTTDWKLLDANIPIGPSGKYGAIYSPSSINISCLEGNFRFAFKYLGGSPDKTTTYNIDNVRITGN